MKVTPPIQVPLPMAMDKDTPITFRGTKPTPLPMTRDKEWQVEVNGVPLPVPNAEQIRPPLDQNKLRIVEQATRTNVEANILKNFQERADEVLRFKRKTAFLTYNKENEEEGKVMDIKVT